MTGPVVQLFVNLRSGSFSFRRINALRRAFEQAGATVVVTESATQHLDLASSAQHLCVVGGDGTLRHVIEALHRSGRTVPVSVYPTGTVNLFARESGYPRAPRAFVDRVLKGKMPTVCHTGMVASLPLLTCASVGPDSYVVDRLSCRLKIWIGRGAYVAAFVRLLFNWPRPTLTLRWDDKLLVCEAVYVAKGRYFAGPWTFAPQARFADAFFHVVALETATRRDFVRFAWRMLGSRPIGSLRGVHAFSCTNLAIEGNPGVPLQADGDVVTKLPAVISLSSNPTLFS